MKWIRPPIDGARYPDHLEADTNQTALRTPFVEHTAPDGKPVHVCMLQVPLDGVLRCVGLVERPSTYVRTLQMGVHATGALQWG